MFPRGSNLHVLKRCTSVQDSPALQEWEPYMYNWRGKKEIKVEGIMLSVCLSASGILIDYNRGGSKKQVGNGLLGVGRGLRQLRLAWAEAQSNPPWIRPGL